MNKTILFVFLLLSIQSVFAQNPRVMLHLKDGTIIKGVLFETGSPETVKIKSKKNVWVFPFSEIEKIDYKAKDRTKEIKNDPFFFTVNGGLLVGNSSNTESEINFFHSSLNWQVLKKTYLGAGAGVEYYFEQSYIPAFLNLEYKLRQTKSTPFFYLKSGYLIPGENQHASAEYENLDSRNIPPKYLNAHGGVLVNPGFGFATMLGENFGLSFSVGYRYQQLRFTGKEKYELKQRYNRLCLSVGILFN
jgi:hypothetical protein